MKKEEIEIEVVEVKPTTSENKKIAKYAAKILIGIYLMGLIGTLNLLGISLLRPILDAFLETGFMTATLFPWASLFVEPIRSMAYLILFLLPLIVLLGTITLVFKKSKHVNDKEIAFFVGIMLFLTTIS